MTSRWLCREIEMRFEKLDNLKRRTRYEDHVVRIIPIHLMKARVLRPSNDAWLEQQGLGPLPRV